MKVLSQIITVSTLFLSTLSYGKISQSEYVENWKDVAIQQMLSHRIPASITMAQGILESGYGNSTLAKKANNHFGIKCHSDWKGKKVYHDDDKKGECFRKYPSAVESFEDHSLFLTSKSRYSDLFALEITDYKSWAKGLRKAGYATNPKYSNLLIDIIERLDLDKLDLKGSNNSENSIPLVVDAKLPSSAVGDKKTKSNRFQDKKVVVNYNTHKLLVNEEKLKFITAVEGDTYYRIAKEFSLNIRQLHRYNDVSQTTEGILPGTKVYLMPKKKKNKKKVVKVNSGNETLRTISQSEGVKLKALLNYNTIESPDLLLPKGETIFLKK
ncbi:MAG: glucosaminidase domain-containing protein [Lishizhenia sp.]